MIWEDSQEWANFVRCCPSRRALCCLNQLAPITSRWYNFPKVGVVFFFFFKMRILHGEHSSSNLQTQICKLYPRMLQHSATLLQHSATRCNTLQHTTTPQICKPYPRMSNLWHVYVYMHIYICIKHIDIYTHIMYTYTCNKFDILACIHICIYICMHTYVCVIHTYVSHIGVSFQIDMAGSLFK